jgi:hypothetical protein
VTTHAVRRRVGANGEPFGRGATVPGHLCTPSGHNESPQHVNRREDAPSWLQGPPAPPMAVAQRGLARPRSLQTIEKGSPHHRSLLKLSAPSTPHVNAAHDCEPNNGWVPPLRRRVRESIPRAPSRGWLLLHRRFLTGQDHRHPRRIDHTPQGSGATVEMVAPNEFDVVVENGKRCIPASWPVRGLTATSPGSVSRPRSRRHARTWP